MHLRQTRRKSVMLTLVILPVLLNFVSPLRAQFGRGTEARTAATDIVPGDTPASGESEFEKNSGSCTTLVAGNVEDCIVKLIYYIFYVIPAFLLSLAGKFFNVIISLTLSSLLYTSSPFISEAWGIVRDL